MNWLTHLPIIFSHLLEIAILFFTMRRRFVNILELIGVLPLSTRLVKILFIVEVRSLIVFARHYVEVVDPLINLRPIIKSRFVTKSRVENAS